MQTKIRPETIYNPSNQGIYQRYFKRPMDFILSLIALIILSPVFLVVALLVRINLGNPVIFKQQRPGLNEKIFTMYKFRTMTNETDENGELLPDSDRLTKFGKFLRSTSLDELPELFNILKGDMSIVGAETFICPISTILYEGREFASQCKTRFNWSRTSKWKKQSVMGTSILIRCSVCRKYIILKRY